MFSTILSWQDLYFSWGCQLHRSRPSPPLSTPATRRALPTPHLPRLPSPSPEGTVPPLPAPSPLPADTAAPISMTATAHPTWAPEATAAPTRTSLLATLLTPGATVVATLALVSSRLKPATADVKSSASPNGDKIWADANVLSCSTCYLKVTTDSWNKIIEITINWTLFRKFVELYACNVH
jgi:hypothetical protein